MTDEIIRTENLKKNFGKLEVLKGIDLSVMKGEVISIIGPSGGGKSTFLRCLNLLEIPDEGKIFFEGTDIMTKQKEKKIKDIRLQEISTEEVIKKIYEGEAV